MNFGLFGDGEDHDAALLDFSDEAIAALVAEGNEAGAGGVGTENDDDDFFLQFEPVAPAKDDTITKEHEEVGQKRKRVEPAGEEAAEFRVPGLPSRQQKRLKAAQLGLTEASARSLENYTPPAGTGDFHLLLIDVFGSDRSPLGRYRVSWKMLHFLKQFDVSLVHGISSRRNIWVQPEVLSPQSSVSDTVNQNILFLKKCIPDFEINLRRYCQSVSQYYILKTHRYALNKLKNDLFAHYLAQISRNPFATATTVAATTTDLTVRERSVGEWVLEMFDRFVPHSQHRDSYVDVLRKVLTSSHPATSSPSGPFQPAPLSFKDEGRAGQVGGTVAWFWNEVRHPTKTPKRMNLVCFTGKIAELENRLHVAGGEMLKPLSDPARRLIESGSTDVEIMLAARAQPVII